MDVQQLAISARWGGGDDLSWENFPIPHVRSDASLYRWLSDGDTCWHHVLIAERRTKGKVKRGLHSSVSSNVFPISTSHTPSLLESKLCKLFILKCQRNQIHKNADRAKTGSFGVRPKAPLAYSRDRRGCSCRITTPFCQEQKKNGLLAKKFSDFWSHSTEVKALVIGDVSFKETTAWPKKKVWNRWVDFLIDLAPEALASHDRSRFSTVIFGGLQHIFSSNGLASSVFIFDQVWFRRFMVSSSSGFKRYQII